MMLLFRASGAGEGWQDIMLSCQAGADCDPATVVPGKLGFFENSNSIF